MLRCIVTDLLSELYNVFKYPLEILDFDFDNNLGVFLNNSVWDVKNGTILKLCEGHYISHAIKGFKKLTDIQIREIYGEPPRFDSLKWPSTNKQLKVLEGAHWTMHGLLEACKIPVIC
jgi:hypothetical protein